MGRGVYRIYIRVFRGMLRVEGMVWYCEGMYVGLFEGLRSASLVGVAWDGAGDCTLLARLPHVSKILINAFLCCL